MNRTPLKTKHSRELSAANKLYLLSLLLPLWTLLPLWGLGGLYAQSCVSVRQISTNYATKQITFDLTWGTCNNTNHLYRVWVFADYQPVTGLVKGAWNRATITSSSAGALHNNAGVWVTGSAGATQRVTLTLDVSPAQFNWCAVAIDYPPNALVNAAGGYTLRGTAPFIVNGSSLGSGIKTMSAGTCITSITDATGNPEGKIPDAPTVSISANTTTINAGSNVTLTATTGGDTTNAMAYTWNVHGLAAATSTSNQYTPTLSTAGTISYSVSVTNANNCTSDVASGVVTVVNNSHTFENCIEFCSTNYPGYYGQYTPNGSDGLTYCSCTPVRCRGGGYSCGNYGDFVWSNGKWVYNGFWGKGHCGYPTTGCGDAIQSPTGTFTYNNRQ